jgi:hypothetical protein
MAPETEAYLRKNCRIIRMLLLIAASLRNTSSLIPQ